MYFLFIHIHIIAIWKKIHLSDINLNTIQIESIDNWPTKIAYTLIILWHAEIGCKLMTTVYASFWYR